ncbi:unnamed protein product, partial [Adineta steineri]
MSSSSVNITSTNLDAINALQH